MGQAAGRQDLYDACTVDKAVYRDLVFCQKTRKALAQIICMTEVMGPDQMAVTMTKLPRFFQLSNIAAMENEPVFL
ncbi:hypothetical protein GCM10027202_32350 [Microvirgula curvata]